MQDRLWAPHQFAVTMSLFDLVRVVKHWGDNKVNVRLSHDQQQETM